MPLMAKQTTAPKSSHQQKSEVEAEHVRDDRDDSRDHSQSVEP